MCVCVVVGGVVHKVSVVNKSIVDVKLSDTRQQGGDEGHDKSMNSLTPRYYIT